MKSNLISKSETSEILEKISSRWKMSLPKSKNLHVYYLEDDAQIITGEGFTALQVNQEYLPFLSNTDLLAKFPSIVVDMGAVKFMCNGANAMRPGIKSATSFEKDQIVCIVEESKHKFLAVGVSVISSKEFDSTQKGEVVKNLHYISDKFWEACKTLAL